MRFIEQLDRAAKKNNSLLCVGLDLTEPLFTANRAIIDATKDLVCAYKPNMAFYEARGLTGLSALIETIGYIRTLEIPVILDAKRGDIGNTSAAYAKSVFEIYKADAATVNPYMGKDSVQPFLDYKEKGVFVLCLTSNAGAKDFQYPLYKTVVQKVREWNTHGNAGLVVGATKPEELKEIRSIAGDMPILVPGVGAQGGDLEAVVKAGGDHIIINASRSIINSVDPRAEAKKLRDEINKYRSR